MKKTYSIMYQGVIIGAIMLISKIIESILPFKMPSSVIGLILLFLALTLKIVKLEQVETVGSTLVNNIGLFFVPAGISVINSFDLLKANFLLVIGLIFISTVFLLVGTGWSTQILMKVDPKRFKVKQGQAKQIKPEFGIKTTVEEVR